ncbi:MAG: gliding motility-associated C-terminal domain-containing protein [Flavobacteriia bacterium]
MKALRTLFTVFFLFGANGAFAQTTDVFSTPGTYTWTVPPCVTTITVQVWGGGGGGGAVWSRFDPTQTSITSDEICTAGGGGGGGGFTTRTYTVVPGQNYTIVVGAGGIGGIINNALPSNRAQNGSVGGNSTFSGPSTATPGTLTALGGNGGAAANILRNCLGGCSGAVHQGSNGVGGSGVGGLNGTSTFTGGNGSAGVHSGSTNDRSGSGGGGAGSSGNGGNASSTTGGAGGSGSGGAGANGIIQSFGSGYLGTNGNNGTTIGGGGSGACGHNRGGNNSSHRTNTGGNGARGEVRITYTAPSLTTPTFDAVAPICSGNPLSPLPTTSTNGITGNWAPVLDNTVTTTYTFTPTSGLCANTTTLSITVNPLPTISTQPQDIPICESGSATMTANATGGAYQWQYYDGTSWINVVNGTPSGFTYSNATSASLDITTSNAPNTAPCLAPEYRLLVGSIPCQIISNTATATVVRATRIAPTGPQCSGTQLNFDACPASAVYSWSVTPPVGTSVTPTSGAGQTFSFIPTNTTGTSQIFTVNSSVTHLGLTCSQVFTPTINAVPNAGTSGSVSVCSSGSNINLYSSLGGSPATTGTWSGDLSGGYLGAYDPSSLGAGTYTYTVAGAGCADATADVVVTEVVAANAGTDGSIAVCETSGSAVDLFSLMTGEDVGGTWTQLTGSGGTFNAGAGAFTPEVSATTSTFEYSVIGTAPCPNDVSVATVTISTAPDAGTDGTLPICQGSTVTAAELFASLGGTPDVGGTWSPALAGAGMYTYTVAATAPCATDAIAQVVVTEITAPDAGTDGTLTICQGTTVTAAELFASLGGTPDAGGTWSPALAGAGTYTYTVTVAGCTDATAIVTVTEQVQPNAGTSGTLTVCQGTVPTNADLFAALSGTPNAGGTWSNVGLVYTYTVAATAPCTSDATATVTVTEQPQPNAGSNGTLDICQGTTVTAAQLFNALSGTPDAGGIWSPALAGAGTYTYTVAATAPCTSDATATVTVTEQAQPNAGTNGTLTVCQGTVPTNAELFAALSGTPNAGGTWINVGLVYTYTVAATAPCTSDATATVTVTEQVQPNAGTNGTLDICQGSTVTNAELFSALSGSPDAGGTWSPALAGAGTYTYTVAATAPCATDATALVELIVSPCDIIIPTAFTPNGDNANDEWEILGLDEQYIENQVFVYNRWGSLIYESTQGDYMSNPWDGTHNLKPLPVGSYYYIIVLEEGSVPLKGTISLIMK